MGETYKIFMMSGAKNNERMFVMEKINEKDFVVNSLELHMFFARIMKEHAIFLEAGFTPANPDWANAADYYKRQFDALLQQSVNLGAAGIVTPESIASRQFVTDYTLGSEQKTAHLTGIQINSDVTRQEAKLWGNPNPNITPQLVENVRTLNASVLPILDGIINFKTQVINAVTSCQIATANYPSEGKHLLEEAQNYKQHLTALMNGQKCCPINQETEFWNNNMKEHAEYMRGKFDPTERERIITANNFVTAYERLGGAKSITETEHLAQFKQQTTDGINRCKISSVMVPLYADHIYREANHFLWEMLGDATGARTRDTTVKG